MFSNMIQPTGIPEVKPADNMGQVNNQASNMGINNVGVMPSANVDAGINSVGQTSVMGSNDNSFIPNTNAVNNTVSSVVNNDPLSNNMVGMGIPPVVDNNAVNSNMGANNVVGIVNDNASNNNVANLDFMMPGEVNNNASVNSQINNVASVSNSNPVGGATNNLNNINNEMDYNLSNIGGEAAVENLNANNIIGNGIEEKVDVLNNSMGAPVTNASSNNTGNNADSALVVPVKKYFLHFLLTSIPVVGMILLIIRAIDKKDKNISNLAKAQLLFSFAGVLVGVIITFIMLGIVGTSIASIINNNSGSAGSNVVDNNSYNEDSNDNYYEENDATNNQDSDDNYYEDYYYEDDNVLES